MSQANPFQNKSFTILYSLILMMFCGVVSWYTTMFFGAPIMLEPDIIVKQQNFLNKLFLNFDTTNGIA